MNKYQTLAANTILMSAGTLGSKLLVFLLVRVYTGCLTPAEFGTADLITQTANLLIPLVSLDVADAVFRFAADRRARQADAALLSSPDPNGHFLVGHGRIGPVHGEMVSGRRSRRHLCRGL